jgi:hypothetical protein
MYTEEVRVRLAELLGTFFFSTLLTEEPVFRMDVEEDFCLGKGVWEGEKQEKRPR